MKKLSSIIFLLFLGAPVFANDEKPQILPLTINLSVEENVTPKCTIYLKQSIGLSVIKTVEGNENITYASFKSEDGKHTERKFYED